MPHDLEQARDLFLELGSKEFTGSLEAYAREELEKAAETVEDEAKRVLGTYDYGWTPLAPATVARGGIMRPPGVDEPLLDTGELRDSIEHYTPPTGPLVSYVGSNNPKAVWHELGTATIPPRSFLLGAATAKEDEIHKTLGDEVHAKIITKMVRQ